MDQERRIEPLTEMAAVVPLALIARSEEFLFLDRLINEWEDRINRFERPGEVIFGYFVGQELVGTAGLTVQREGVGRVRRVYVHPIYRRQGIAKLLMDSVLAVAQANFSTVVLYTETLEARAIYEKMGFIPESADGPDHATHRMHF